MSDQIPPPQGAQEANEPPPPGSSPHSRRRLVIAGTAALAAAALAAVLIVTLSGQKATAPKIFMTGIITVADNGGGYIDTGHPCPTDNLGVNADVAVGTQIVVRSDTGKVVGTGAIITGLSVRGANGSPSNACNYVFAVAHLPAEPFYQVQIPGHGQVTVRRADAHHVRLTIGG